MQSLPPAADRPSWGRAGSKVQSILTPVPRECDKPTRGPAEMSPQRSEAFQRQMDSLPTSPRGRVWVFCGERCGKEPQELHFLPKPVSRSFPAKLLPEAN